MRRSGDVARVRAVRDDEHLERREDIAIDALFLVLLHLIERFFVRHLAALELNLDDGKPVDEERHVTTTVNAHLFELLHPDLMHNLIDRRAACDVLSLENNWAHGAERGVVTDNLHTGNTVLALQPLRGVVIGREAELVLYLLELLVRQWMLVEELLVVVHEDVAEVLPEIIDGMDILGERPLGLILRELADEVLLDDLFLFVVYHAGNPPLR